MESNNSNAISFFERYLTLWVLLCIGVGVGLGSLLGNQVEVLSDFTFYQVNIPVAILIWLMIYPMMLQIDFASLKEIVSVPAHLVQRLRKGIEQHGISMASTKITVLGRAFKADIDDDRLSPSLRVIEMLDRLGANVVVHDPYLSDIQLDEALRGAHGVVLATNHSMYYKLDMGRLAELVHPECVIVDGWGVFSAEEAAAVGIELNTFGRG